MPYFIHKWIQYGKYTYNSPKRLIEENEVRFEEINCEDADYLIIAFGSMARIGQKAMELAREEVRKVVVKVSTALV